MLLTEVAGKEFLKSHGLSIPLGIVVRKTYELASPDIQYPVALKAQVSSGGRGKAGGIRRCNNAAEAEDAMQAIMALTFDGERPQSILVEPWMDISRELYVALTIDGRAGGYVLLYSGKGGVDIESSSPPVRYEIGPASNFRGYRLREILNSVESDKRIIERVIGIARRLLEIAHSEDCTLVEINPLAVLNDGSLIAADAKVSLDESAAFRHKATEIAISEERRNVPEDIRRALDANLMLVWLDGEIGLLSGGAGMTMAAMDEVDSAGARAACFLDCSGNPRPAGLSAAIELLDSSTNVKGILVSIFGGGLQTDRLARSFVEILGRRSSKKPIAFRLNGTGSEAATEILRDVGFQNHTSLRSAVKEIITAVGGAK